jgi:hypothetical protein
MRLLQLWVCVLQRVIIMGYIRSEFGRNDFKKKKKKVGRVGRSITDYHHGKHSGPSHVSPQIVPKHVSHVSHVSHVAGQVG